LDHASIEDIPGLLKGGHQGLFTPAGQALWLRQAQANKPSTDVIMYGD
jgi:hypothetical protein